MRRSPIQLPIWQCPSTGYLVLEVFLNFQSCCFLIDTGASKSCLHTDALYHYRLREQGKTMVNMHTMGHIHQDVEVGQLWINNWQAAGHELPPQKLISLNLSTVCNFLLSVCKKEILGILGADFFTKNQASIHYNKMQLILQHA